MCVSHFVWGVEFLIKASGGAKLLGTARTIQYG